MNIPYYFFLYLSTPSTTPKHSTSGIVPSFTPFKRVLPNTDYASGIMSLNTNSVPSFILSMILFINLFASLEFKLTPPYFNLKYNVFSFTTSIKSPSLFLVSASTKTTTKPSYPFGPLTYNRPTLL